MVLIKVKEFGDFGGVGREEDLEEEHNLETVQSVADLTGRFSANGLTGEGGFRWWWGGGGGAEVLVVVEEETEGGVGTTRESGSSTSGWTTAAAATGVKVAILGQRKVPWGLQILKPLFSLCILAALSSFISVVAGLSPF